MTESTRPLPAFDDIPTPRVDNVAWEVRDLAKQLERETVVWKDLVVAKEEEIERLRDSFSEGVSAPRWIPVEEKLPPDGVLVAVRDADGEYGYDIHEDGGWECYEAALEEFQAVRCAEMTFGCKPPVCWMPLPEAPK